MVTYRSFRTPVVYAAETSMGAGASSFAPIEGKIQQFTWNPNNNIIRLLGLGEGRNETFQGLGNFIIDWNLDMEVGGFDFLQHAFGPRQGSGTAAAPYFLPEQDFIGYAGTQCRTATISVQGEGPVSTHDIDKLHGSIINTIGLSLELGQTLKANIVGFARTVTHPSSLESWSAYVPKPWLYAQGNFEWNTSNVGLVQSITININNNIDPEVGRGIGSRFVVEWAFGRRTYDWVAVVKTSDTIATTLRNHFYGDSDNLGVPSLGVADAEPDSYTLKLKLSEGSSAGNRNAFIQLRNSIINDISKPINIGENLVQITVNGTAKGGLVETDPKPIKWWTAA